MHRGTNGCKSWWEAYKIAGGWGGRGGLAAGQWSRIPISQWQHLLSQALLEKSGNLETQSPKNMGIALKDCWISQNINGVWQAFTKSFKDLVSQQQKTCWWTLSHFFPILLPSSSSSPWRPRASFTAISFPPLWFLALAVSSTTLQSTLLARVVRGSLPTSVIATAEFWWSSALPWIGLVS